MRNSECYAAVAKNKNRHLLRVTAKFDANISNHCLDLFMLQNHSMIFDSKDSIFQMSSNGFTVGWNIILPSFVTIAWTVAEKWRFLYFQNGGYPPSWTDLRLDWDNPRRVLGGIDRFAKFSWNCNVQYMRVSMLCEFCLKMLLTPILEGFGEGKMRKSVMFFVVPSLQKSNNPCLTSHESNSVKISSAVYLVTWREQKLN